MSRNHAAAMITAGLCMLAGHAMHGCPHMVITASCFVIALHCKCSLVHDGFNPCLSSHDAFKTTYHDEWQCCADNQDRKTLEISYNLQYLTTLQTTDEL